MPLFLCLSKDSRQALNKAHCQTLATQYLETAPADTQVAAVIIDLDFFKQINDAIGHLGGDEVLQRLSSVIAAATPADTIIGRWGGDEFFIFFQQVESNAILEATLEGICTSMCRKITYQGRCCNASVSIGAAAGAINGHSLHDFLSIADAALYDVKRTTRNSYKIVYRTT